jgi:hypothetical protein
MQFTKNVSCIKSNYKFYPYVLHMKGDQLIS